MLFMDTVIAEITDGEGRRKLTRLRGRFANFRPVMEERVGPFIREEIRKQFESEGAYFGTKWQEISDSTKQWRAKHGYDPEGPILYASGALYRSLVDENDANAELIADEHGLVIRSRVPWGIYHQSPEEPREHIPRREVVPDVMPETFMVQLRKMITGYLIEVEFGA